MATNRPPFEETPEYQSLIADMNSRIEAELRVMNNYVISHQAELSKSEVRQREQKCMDNQTAITLEVKAKIARLKEAYDKGESDD